MRAQHGNEEGQAISLHQLSMLYRLTEDYHHGPGPQPGGGGAEPQARASRRGVAATLHEQGLIYNLNMARAAGTDDEAAGHRQQAVERFQQSLAINRRIGNEAGAANSLGELGKLLRDAGQMREAIAAFTEVLPKLTRRLDNPVKVGIGLELLGIVHERQGQYAAALEKYEEALGLLRKYGSPQR